jgi:hypothetical protein
MNWEDDEYVNILVEYFPNIHQKRLKDHLVTQAGMFVNVELICQ